MVFFFYIDILYDILYRYELVYPKISLNQYVFRYGYCSIFDISIIPILFFFLTIYYRYYHNPYIVKHVILIRFLELSVQIFVSIILDVKTRLIRSEISLAYYPGKIHHRYSYFRFRGHPDRRVRYFTNILTGISTYVSIADRNSKSFYSANNFPATNCFHIIKSGGGSGGHWFDGFRNSGNFVPITCPAAITSFDFFRSKRPNTHRNR